MEYYLKLKIPYLLCHYSLLFENKKFLQNPSSDSIYIPVSVTKCIRHLGGKITWNFKKNDLSSYSVILFYTKINLNHK